MATVLEVGDRVDDGTGDTYVLLFKRLQPGHSSRIVWEYQVQRESDKVTRWITEDVLLLNSTKI